jgi:hypothetical protein
MLLTEDWRPTPGQTPCGSNCTHSLAIGSGLREAAKVGRYSLLFGKRGWLAIEVWGHDQRLRLGEMEPSARALLVFGRLLSAREKMLIASSAH